MFLWRRQYQRGELRAGRAARAREAVILPVHVAQLPRDHTPRAIEATPVSSGTPRIEIELAEGPRVKDFAGTHSRSGATMLSVPAGVRIWLVAGVTDMRAGLDGLSALVQTRLLADVFSGQLFIFRGRRSDRVKIIWRDCRMM